MTFLFLLVAALLATIAVAALRAGALVAGLAAAVLALWMGGLAARGLRRR